jgi:hypothetical protein
MRTTATFEQPGELFRYVLNIGRTVEGRVTDSSGSPVAGATVEIESLNSQSRPLQLRASAITRDDGTFVVSGLSLDAALLELCAEHSLHGSAGVYLREFDSWQEIVLSSDLALELAVFDAATGAPLERATQLALAFDPRPGTTALRNRAARSRLARATNEGGIVRVRLPRWVRGLQVSCTGYAPEEVSLGEHEQAAMRLEVRMRRTGRTEIRVIDRKSRAAIEDAAVQCVAMWGVHDDGSVDRSRGAPVAIEDIGGEPVFVLTDWGLAGAEVWLEASAWGHFMQRPRLKLPEQPLPPRITIELEPSF